MGGSARARIASAPNSLMILLFMADALDTDRTTSIPWSILGAIRRVSAIGETLNIMNLGGMALSRGHTRRRVDGDIEVVTTIRFERQAAEKEQDLRPGQRRGDHALADSASIEARTNNRLIADRLMSRSSGSEGLDDVTSS